MQRKATWITHGHPRLRTVLALSGLLQILGAIGLVGYFSYTSSSRAIESLSDRVLEQLSDRVIEHLTSYTQKPKIATQINQHSLELQPSKPPQLLTWNKHLYHQSQVFDSLSYLYYGDREGRYIEIEHASHLNRRQLRYGDQQRDGTLKNTIFSLDGSGNIQKALKKLPYDPRTRPWYQTAQTRQAPSWTPIYTFVEQVPTLGISFVRPWYDQTGQLQGVFGADYSLLRTQAFLKNLELLKSGKAFIIETNGNLVATSASPNPFTDRLERINGTQYADALIQTTVQTLQSKRPSAAPGSTPQNLKFVWQDSTQYVRVVPFNDPDGLQWQVVVVIPETDFMGEIQQNRQTMVWIVGLASLGAILSSFLTSRWLVRSISPLIQSSQKIGTGNLNDAVPMLRRASWEMVTLSKSLEVMRQDLKVARDRLQNYTDDLEHNVQQRTSDLTARNLELAKALQELQLSQDHLVRSEKLAALGKLVASIAHEMNTPLGVIRSSTHNLVTFLNCDLSGLIQIIPQLSTAQYQELLQLLNQVLQAYPEVSAEELPARSRRQLRQQIAQDISQVRHASTSPDSDPATGNHTEQIADLLIDLGIHDNLASIQHLLQSPKNATLFEVLYHVNSSQQSLQSIRSATDAAVSVIEALRLYDAQERQRQFVLVNVIDTIETALKLYENLLRRGVTVERNYEGSFQIWACPSELYQVWGNLIQNALQAMDYQGKLGITIANSHHTRDQGQITVQIANTGQPISAEVIPHLFEPFFTTRPPGEGKGMGLTIVKQIVDKHYGQIQLHQPSFHPDARTELNEETEHKLTEDRETERWATKFIVTLPRDFRTRSRQ